MLSFTPWLGLNHVWLTPIGLFYVILWQLESEYLIHHFDQSSSCLNHVHRHRKNTLGSKRKKNDSDFRKVVSTKTYAKPVTMAAAPLTPEEIQLILIPGVSQLNIIDLPIPTITTSIQDRPIERITPPPISNTQVPPVGHGYYYQPAPHPGFAPAPAPAPQPFFVPYQVPIAPQTGFIPIPPQVPIRQLPPPTPFVLPPFRDDAETRRLYVDTHLDADQLDYVEKSIEILNKHNILVNVSAAGAGKTYTTLATAALMGKPLCVVCPKSTIEWWAAKGREFGVPLIFTMTYSATQTDSNPYVTSMMISHKKREEKIYTASQQWVDLVSKGIMLVYDESHALQNAGTNQTKVAQALIRSILSMAGVPGATPTTTTTTKSCVVMLSGSIMTDEKNCLTFLRSFGLFTERSLCRSDVQSRDMVYAGFDEVAEHVRRVAPNADMSMHAISKARRVKTAVLTGVVYDWFCKYLRPALLLEMPKPQINAAFIPEAGYFEVPIEVAKQAGDLLAAMGELMSYDYATGILSEEEQGARGQVFKLMPKLEDLKIRHIVIPEARKLLRGNPKHKVVIFCNSLASLDIIEAELAEFQPAVIDGSCSAKDRQHNINAFQTNPDCRVFAAIIEVGGVGVSLDDTVGDAPRTVYIIPDFSIISMHQAAHRIYRRLTKSPAHVILVFVNVDLDQQSLIAALARKDKVLRDMMVLQVAQGTIFPGRYPQVNHGQMYYLRRAGPIIQEITYTEVTPQSVAP